MVVQQDYGVYNVTMQQIHLEKFAYGGQAIGTLDNGKKVFVWGGLPNEIVTIELIRERSHYAEAIVRDVIEASSERVVPRDPDSYLATSPWQIVNFDAELNYKAGLVDEAFRQQGVELAEDSVCYSDNHNYFYRNKYQFYLVNSTISSGNTLDIAYIERQSNTRTAFDQCSLAMIPITELATAIRDILRTKHIKASELESLVIRSSQTGNTTWQLTTNNKNLSLSDNDITALRAQGGEVVYRNSRQHTTRLLQKIGNSVLNDTIDNITYSYQTDSFFQINLPVYQLALNDIKKHILADAPLIDLYSGVGAIGLTVGSKDQDITLIEQNPNIKNEIESNIVASGKSARAILTATESALDHITPDAQIIVDPPRAGLAKSVIEKLLEIRPPRIVYLSCNPITEARDAKLLAPAYHITANRSYDFFPHTPHIENLVILDRITETR